MRIEYTKEGMKITHSTGVVQILSVKDLERLKTRRTQRISEINVNVARISAHITETQKIVKDTA